MSFPKAETNFIRVARVIQELILAKKIILHVNSDSVELSGKITEDLCRSNQVDVPLMLRHTLSHEIETPLLSRKIYPPEHPFASLTILGRSEQLQIRTLMDGFEDVHQCVFV